jgi:hypothetical protein
MRGSALPPDRDRGADRGLYGVVFAALPLALLRPLRRQAGAQGAPRLRGNGDARLAESDHAASPP